MGVSPRVLMSHICGKDSSQGTLNTRKPVVGRRTLRDEWLAHAEGRSLETRPLSLPLYRASSVGKPRSRRGQLPRFKHFHKVGFEPDGEGESFER